MFGGCIACQPDHPQRRAAHFVQHYRTCTSMQSGSRSVGQCCNFSMGGEKAAAAAIQKNSPTLPQDEDHDDLFLLVDLGRARSQPLLSPTNPCKLRRSCLRLAGAWNVPGLNIKAFCSRLQFISLGGREAGNLQRHPPLFGESCRLWCTYFVWRACQKPSPPAAITRTTHHQTFYYAHIKWTAAVSRFSHNGGMEMFALRCRVSQWRIKCPAGNDQQRMLHTLTY